MNGHLFADLRPAEADTSPRLRVLVVDDNRDTANTTACLLRLLGHHAVAAYDGPGALRVAAALSPHIALLDLGLTPAMTGCEVARRLRRQVGLLVAVTGFDRDEDHRRCCEAGFDHFLVKPADLPDLRRVLADGEARAGLCVAV
jgi:two-component system CheB/CheR fusion protein